VISPALLPGGAPGDRSIRAAAAAALAAAERGGLSWRVDRARLPEAAHFVAEVTMRSYPTLAIPLHGRWLHFQAGGVDRPSLLPGYGDPVRAGRLRVGLVTVSVFLDAGAGSDWRYHDPIGGQDLGRSEGLAAASFDAFLAGRFSGRGEVQADSAGLAVIDEVRLGEILQVGPVNPMPGLEGRASMLRRLGRIAGGLPGGRVGGLFDLIVSRFPDARIPAGALLEMLLRVLAPLWHPGPGDVWAHPTLGEVPLHKLCQWLTYSLVEPLRQSGAEVTDLDDLTALAEYRNGGLLVDTGVLVPRRPLDPAFEHPIGSPFVVEWRALTVALIDLVAAEVRAYLGRPELSLGQVLEGGTWRAGRELAAQLRPEAAPPFRVASDGTIF
jgi:hypothetical protein